MSDIKKVALFVTCMVDQIMPDVGVAAVRLLRRAHFEVDFPLEQTCCGQPFFNSGFRPQAARLAKRTVEVLEPYDAVVLPSGSCTSMIRVEFPHLLQDSPRWYYPARRLAAKTYELSQFLSKFRPDFFEQVNDNDVNDNDNESPLNETITYHDSCHMNRILRLKNEPRQLLQKAGYAIDEMEESDRCCGFGGVFSIRMPEVSNAITADKIRQAKETQARTVVTADPGCLMQMRGMVRDGDDIEIKHLAVALEEATR